MFASAPPDFEKLPPKSITVKFLAAFQLKCSSKPPVIYPSVWDWRKDGQPLSVEDIRSKRITSSVGTLVVRSAVAEDSGNYTCELVNSAGSVENSGTKVVVEGKASWKFFLQGKPRLVITVIAKLSKAKCVVKIPFDWDYVLRIF